MLCIRKPQDPDDWVYKCAPGNFYPLKGYGYEGFKWVWPLVLDMATNLSNVAVDALNSQAATSGVEAKLLKISDSKNGSVFIIPKQTDGETVVEIVPADEMDDIQEHIEY